jgi:hypothetical protein
MTEKLKPKKIALVGAGTAPTGQHIAKELSTSKRFKNIKATPQDIQLQLMKAIAIKDIPDFNNTESIVKCSIFNLYLKNEIDTLKLKFKNTDKHFIKTKLSITYSQLNDLGFNNPITITNEILTIIQKKSILTSLQRTCIIYLYANPCIKATIDLYTLIKTKNV